jgi:hypothetical protein
MTLDEALEIVSLLDVRSLTNLEQAAITLAEEVKRWRRLAAAFAFDSLTLNCVQTSDILEAEGLVVYVGMGKEPELRQVAEKETT